MVLSIYLCWMMDACLLGLNMLNSTRLAAAASRLFKVYLQLIMNYFPEAKHLSGLSNHLNSHASCRITSH